MLGGIAPALKKRSERAKKEVGPYKLRSRDAASDFELPEPFDAQRRSGLLHDYLAKFLKLAGQPMP
jgi:hypothetical protein